MEENEKQAIDFLKNDFCQCFEQMRYYDTQIFEVFKYLAGFYATLAGLGIGLYQYFFVERNINVSLALSAGLIVGLIFGILMFALIIRNRVYFVCVARYVNEQRNTFLAFKPLGFENRSRMYANPLQPPYFNWRSSQSWWMYTVALQNTFLLTITFYIIGCKAVCMLFSGVLFFVLQLLIGIFYLHEKEGKTIPKAVFGRDK